MGTLTLGTTDRYRGANLAGYGSPGGWATAWGIIVHAIAAFTVATRASSPEAGAGKPLPLQSVERGKLVAFLPTPVSWETMEDFIVLPFLTGRPCGSVIAPPPRRWCPASRSRSWVQSMAITERTNSFPSRPRCFGRRAGVCRAQCALPDSRGPGTVGRRNLVTSGESESETGRAAHPEPEEPAEQLQNEFNQRGD